MSTKVGITAEEYKVKENTERTTKDAVTGLNQQQKESDGLKIQGLALPFDKRSRNGVVYEKQSVKQAAESLVGCPLLFNHNEENPIGHIEDVEIKEDGLYYFGDLNEEKKETDSLQRGDIPHVSIQATIKETMESETQGKVAVKEFLEMSAVTVPGFSSTDVEAEETVRIEKLVKQKTEQVSQTLEQADYQYETGDWVQWEFADGTATGVIRERENEPGESLEVEGGEREATEEEPVYKMEEWDDEQEELTDMVVKSESELTEVDDPRESQKLANELSENNSEAADTIAEVFEFSPVPSHVLFDEKNKALQRAKDLGLDSVHKHVMNNKEFWMAGNTHEEWKMAINDNLAGSTNQSFTENKSKEPFQGFDDFDDCVQTMMDEEGHDEETAKKICGAIKKRNEIKAKNEALSDVDLTPPDRVKNAAQAALDWEEENPDREDCGTGIGDSRANSITNETLSPEDFLGGENTAIPDYLESHEEDVTAEGTPTEWSDEEMNDCGNRQYAKWGFYLDWFKQKERELQEAKEEALNDIKGDKPLTEKQDDETQEEQNSKSEQLQEISEDDFTGTVADMYEEVSASDAAELMEDFTFSSDPEPVIALAADAMDMTPADLTDMVEGTHGDMDDEDEEEAGDMDDEDDDMEESESSNKKESEQNQSQNGDNSMEDMSKEELQEKVKQLSEKVMELEDTEPSKQEAANTAEDEDDSYLSDEFKNRVLR
jgi:phage head maturation protease